MLLIVELAQQNITIVVFNEYNKLFFLCRNSVNLQWAIVHLIIMSSNDIF